MLDEVLNLAAVGARVTVLGDVNDPIYAYFNPSIAYDGNGKLRINIRACNFAVKPHGIWYLRGGAGHAHTKNLYGHIDPDTLEITDLKEVQYSENTPRDIADISGLEDARLFWRKDGMHFSGVKVDTRTAYRYPAQQAEFVYDEKTNTLKYLGTMLAKSPARSEKNWLPADKPTTAFDYVYSPTEVYVKRAVEGEQYDGFIHGSSQLLWQPKTKTYLGVLHSKHYNAMIVGQGLYDTMIYVHYFAEYNAKGKLIRISEPFTFGLQDNIEFVAGAVEHKGKLLMSLGVGDGRMAFASLDKDKVIDMLTEYKGTEINPLPPITGTQQRYIDLETRRLYNETRRSGRVRPSIFE